MVTRVYPDSVPKLMERYDIRYEERFIVPTNVESCTDRRMAELKNGIERDFRYIREDIVIVNSQGGRVTRESADVLTHDEIADWLAITTAYEAIEKMQPTFFYGDLGARMRMNPNDRRIYECMSNPPCPGIVLYVDGERAPRLEELHGIQAAEIQKIEYVKGADATGIYGEDHHQGAILVTTVGARPQRENIGSEPEDRTGWSGPYTRQEAQVMSEIWESIRGAARYEDVNWSVLNMTSAPGSAEAQQNTSIHWETLRGAGIFSEIDWEASTGYSQTSNSPPENLTQPSSPPK